MLSYVFRWIYAGLVFMLTLMLGYVGAIKPCMQQLNALKKDEQRLIIVVTRARENVPAENINHSMVVAVKKNALDRITDIQAIALKYGLIINAISDAVAMRFEMQGDYGKFALFISALSAAGYAQMINGFSVQLDKLHQLHFTIAMATLGSSSAYRVKHEKTSVLGLHNPFCLQSDRWVAQTDPALQLIDSRLLKGAKMIGYMQQGHRSQALIVFSTNQIAALEEGSIIGKDGTEVAEVVSDHVLLKLPENNYWKLEY